MNVINIKWKTRLIDAAVIAVVITLYKWFSGYQLWYLPQILIPEFIGWLIVLILFDLLVSLVRHWIKRIKESSQK